MTDGKVQKRPKLRVCLESSSWRRLLAIMETLGLSASTRQKKGVLVDRLTQHLQHAQIIKESIAHFLDEDQRALQVLIEANGSLPALPFTERFGPIRTHRPWKNAATANEGEKPWLNPISSSERLLYHGFIYHGFIYAVRMDSMDTNFESNAALYIVIPDELLAILRGHFATQGSSNQRLIPLPRPGISGGMLNHFGIWLALLCQQPVKVRHNYWLPPSLLASLIHRLGLEAPLPCRSERHVPYLAFLHILAESCQLIEHDETIRTTPTAWLWMAKPWTERLAELWDALMPSKPDNPAFISRIKLPWESNDIKARQLIRIQLQNLAVGQPVRVEEWLERLRLQDRWHVLSDSQVGDWEDVDDEGHPWATIDPVRAFCIGPLFWIGAIDLFHEEETNDLHMALTATGAWLLGMPNSQKPTEASGTHIQVVPNSQDRLFAPIDVRPDYLCRIMPYCNWPDDADMATDMTQQENHRQRQLILSPERITLAAAAGLSATEIMQDLATSLGQPVSRRMSQRVRAWAKEGQRIRIQTVTVVETESAELMAELRRKKLTRRRLGPPISPNRAIIDPEQVAGLITSLATMEIIAANPFDRYDRFAPAAQSADLSTDSPATDSQTTDLPKQTQWMLLQLYRALGQHVDLAVKIPWEIEKSLEAQLSAKERMSAAEAARVINEQIESNLNGYLRIPNWKMPFLMEAEEDEPDDSDELDEGTERQSRRRIKRLLQEAIADSQPVRIHYWSANHDHPLQRTVTPYYIEERHHIEYLTGYCHLREEERVFRVDRIERVR